MAESGLGLFQLALAQAQAENANNPFFGLSRGFQEGVDSASKVRASQQRLNQFQKLFTSASGQLGEDFKIEPKFDMVSGNMSAEVVRMSPEEQFIRDAKNANLDNIEQIRQKHPMFMDEVDKIEIDLQRSVGKAKENIRRAQAQAVGDTSPKIKTTLAKANSLAQDPNRTDVRRGRQIPRAGQLQELEPPDIVVEDFDPLGRPKGGTSISARKQIKREEATTSKAVEGASEQAKAALKANQNFSRVAAATKELVSRAKQATNEMGGFGAAQVAKAKIGQTLAKSGLVDVPPEKQFSGLDVFGGQLVEMTLALSPILTGQNRIIEGVVQMLRSTLPSFPTTETKFLGQTQQTMRNAFRLSSALGKGLISIEEIEALNDADEETIQDTLQNVMNTSTLSPEEEELFQRLWEDVKSTPAAIPETFDSQELQIFSIEPIGE